MKPIIQKYLSDKLTQKTLLYCGILFITLVLMYTIKTLAIKHFIGQFQKQLPWITITHPKQHHWVEQYHTVGQLSALQTINLSPKEPGIIEHILFKPGQSVTKGQPLIDMENANERAQFKLQVAELELQTKSFAQYKILYHQHNISKSQYWQAKASFKKAEATLEDAKARLEHKQILAPFSGMMGIPEVHIGQYISPGQQHIATLQKTSLLNLDIRVPERFFKQLKIGRTLSFQTQDQPNRIFHAKIYAIEPASESNAHTIWIRARVKNNNQQFLPGGFVNVTVPVSPDETTLSVPQTAILTTVNGPTLFYATQQTNQDNHQLAWQVHQMPVQVGPSKNLQSIILSKLDKNAWIVDSGTQKIRHLSFAEVKEKHE